MVLAIAEQSNSHSQKDKNKYHEEEFAYMLVFLKQIMEIIQTLWQFSFPEETLALTL